MNEIVFATTRLNLIFQDWTAQESHCDFFRAGFCCDNKPAAHQLNQQNLPVCVQPQLRVSGKHFSA